jgi:hypothetical protein
VNIVEEIRQQDAALACAAAARSRACCVRITCRGPFNLGTLRRTVDYDVITIH